MEFKEFENSESSEYDINVGVGEMTSAQATVLDQQDRDEFLGEEEVIDLNTDYLPIQN